MNLRHSTRALLLDPANRLLLLQCKLPDRSFWVAPGGGLEPGESAHDALRRELQEEVGGLVSADVDGHVWRQVAVGPYAANHDGVLNDYYVVRTDHFTPEATPEWEVEGIAECRWWTLEELLASAEVFSPLALPTLLQQLLHAGPPVEPILIGV